MITFKQFLAEAGAHKQVITVDEAVKLINTHCRDALKNRRQLYRGMTPDGDAFALHGEASKRRSANTQNYYTVVMDHFLPAFGYPKRSESIILANNLDTARGFGRVYAIFPYDGVPIGVCSSDDLWYTPEFTVGNAGDEMRIQSWNKVWDEYGLSPASYEQFVESIKTKMEGGVSPNAERTARMLRDIFGSPENVERVLRKAYSPQTLDLHLATTKTIDDYSGDRELWIGGKCIAIERTMWEKMKQDDHDDELAPEDD